LAYPNRDQQLLHESDAWLELSRSEVRNMLIRRSPEIESQQLDIVSNGYARLSIGSLPQDGKTDIEDILFRTQQTQLLGIS
jgi:hypothetical protein